MLSWVQNDNHVLRNKISRFKYTIFYTFSVRYSVFLLECQETRI